MLTILKSAPLYALMLPMCVWAVNVEVTIQGLDQDKALKENALAGLSVIQKTHNRDLSREQIEILHRRAPEEIKVALQPFGYYHAQVSSTLNASQDPILITYSVKLNAPTVVDEVELAIEGPGEYNPLLSNALSGFPLATGDTLNHTLYEKGKNTLLNNVYGEGYLKAHFTRHDILVDLSRFQADIALTLSTGPQYTLGEVTFEPNYYAPEYLQRFVEFKEVEPYRLSTVTLLEERLMQSSLFDSVLITPQVPDESTEAPLSVKVKEAAANRYLMGIGYDTNTKARLRLGWDRKKINRWGHQFKSNIKLSEQDTLLDAYYKIPGKRPWVDHYQIAVGYADEEYSEKPSQRYTAEISQTRELWGWHRTIALRYLHEEYKDSDFVSEQSSFLLPSLRLSKSKLDDPFDPKNGYRVQLSIRGGLDALVGSHNFIQFYGQYKWIKAVSEHGTVLARTELGFTLPDDVEELPLSIRFYAGGNDSLRGFRYRSLPPEIDEEGNLRSVGGAYLVLGSLEYNHTLWGPIKWAAFVDGGSALQDVHDDLQLAAGLGLRWQTPVGPLKLDVAKPLSNGAQVLRLHFSFGPEL